MYPIASIVELTILFGNSCGGLHGRDHFDCVAPTRAITLTLGLGVTGRCEIPKGMEEPSVRRIEGRKSPFLERHQGRGFTDMQRPEADLGTFSDALCIRHGLYFTGRRCTVK